MDSSLRQLSILDKVEDCTLLHRGGEADVYGVVAAGNEYVLKWYRGSRFDADVVQKLESLNIPGLYRVRESGLRDNTAYLLYDFVSGVGSAEAPQIPVVVALLLLRKVCQTLGALADSDIHHGDLNPANVIFCPSKVGLRTVLIDCGIIGPGALAYAAPERFQGKSASVKSDLFSVGLMLFRWITGRDLLEAADFDGYAAQSASIDSVDETEILYGMGSFSAQELSALAPLWKSLLQSNPDKRAEDFDELDELIEIALSTLGVGEVTARTLLCRFADALLNEKSGPKFPTSVLDREKSALPYRKLDSLPKKNNRKFAVLGIFGFILILVMLWLVFGTETPDIDAAGNLLLEKSRSLESVDTENDILRGAP